MPHRSMQSAPARVVVVDDDLGTRLLVERLMEPHYDICAAADFAAFQSTLQSDIPVDLVLTDIKLGKGRSGSDVLEATRAYAGSAAIPVVALTARTRPGGRTHYLAMGFDGYVSKPFTQQTLFRELGRCFAASR
jgi:CheY-like chemotaxis protein